MVSRECFMDTENCRKFYGRLEGTWWFTAGVTRSERLREQTIQYRLKNALYSGLPPFGPHLGPKQIATLQTGSHHFVFICKQMGSLLRCQLSKHHPMLLVIVGLDQSIHMAKKLSLSQCLATDFEGSCVCLDLFVICWSHLQIIASDCAEYNYDEMRNLGSLI